MLLTKTKLVSTAYRPGQYDPQPLCEVAVVGRSNAGKSSLINTICNNKKLARVSSAPGKTRSINFYEMDAALMLVDLPGYGFAKVDKKEKMRWGAMMDGYFQQSTHLRHVLHLVDIRHEPTQEDIAMSQYFRQMGIPFTVIATKADKISRGARMKQIAPICRALLVQPWEILCYSSENGQGRSELLGMLGGLLQKPEELLPEEEPEEEADAAEEADDSAE